ncbi:MAG: M15 family metallopeptidase [Clostridiales Family XIII bacterium]|nr:M15 family metallopeptidase [Clostridiales Family XIII bacterium]
MRKLSLVALALLVLICGISLVACASGDSERDSSGSSSSLGSDLGSEEIAADDAKPYYYEEGRAERYASYAEANPELSYDEVVWRVDADVDKGFYEDTAVADDPNSQLVLINKHSSLPDDFVPQNIVSISGGAELRADAAEAIEEMMRDASQAGVPFFVRTGYRSIAWQRDLYNSYLERDTQVEVDTYSARPGFSEHNTGLTMDLSVEHVTDMHNFDNTPQSAWVAENAWKYGYIVRYTEENSPITGYIEEQWHIRFIGREHAKAMKESGVGSLEEYLVKYVWHLPPEK